MASSNWIGKKHVSLSSDEKKKKGLKSSSTIFVPKRKKTPLTLELGCLSCSQIYFEIKHSLYQGLLHEEHTIPFIASPVLSLSLTS